jgi:aromatic ring-opening dioxygenase catalytic subunit (LigB family)
MSQEDGITRRQVIVGGIGAAGVAAIAAGTNGGGGTTPASAPADHTAQAAGRMPVVYLPHGGGPWPWLDMFDRRETADLTRYLEKVRQAPGRAPTAVLVISAHWEERVPTVMTAERPPLLFDYYGFPEQTYQITWPAPGAPALATRVQALLGAAASRARRTTRAV